MTTLGQARNAFPAYRVFVLGHEVTDDILNLSTSTADDTRAPSTAQFTLSDKPLDMSADGPRSWHRYVMQDNDIMALYPDDLDPQTVELPDLAARLANDPLLETFRRLDVVSAFESITSGSARTGLVASRTSELTQKFTEEEYIPRLAEAESNIDVQIRNRILRIADPVKRKILLAKYNRKVYVEQPDLHETGIRLLRDPRRIARLKGQAFRYNFWSGRPIFHSNDPVRIFRRDDLNPRFWYYAFTGYISDWTVNRTTKNDDSVTFTCEDALRPFRYARITTNPGIFDVRFLQQAEDFTVRTFFNDDFTQLTLPELLYTLIFGPELAGTTDFLLDQGNLTRDDVQRIRTQGVSLSRINALGEETVRTIPPYGVGAFSFSRSATLVFGSDTDTPDASRLSNLALDPSRPTQGPTTRPTPPKILQREVRLDGEDALAVYQGIVDHQVRSSDLATLLLEGETATATETLARDWRTGDVSTEAIITEIGENPQRYPIDGGRLFILTPASLGGLISRGIMERDYRGPEVQTTWKTRLGILYDVLQRIEFSFYASPKGDILAEMPLYDFEPRDFGEARVTSDQIERAFRTVSNTARALYTELAQTVVGPYAPHYEVAKEDCMDSNQTLTDEKIRTQFRTSWQNIQGYRGTGNSDSIGLAPAVVTLRPLVPQFGIRCEQAEPQIYIASPEAAQVYCALKLNQWNAEALTSQVDMVRMMRMGPNRPIRVADGNYIACVRSVTRTDAWNSDFAQTTGVNYTRTWDGLLDDDGKPVYSTIGGAAARTLNYALLFRRRRLEEPTKDRSGSLDALTETV